MPTVLIDLNNQLKKINNKVDCPFNDLNLLYQLIPIFLRSIHSFFIEIENVLKIVA